jgi:hypothetical protein
MSDKEKLLASIIVIILGAIMSYRIAFVDSELKELDDRIDKIMINKQEPI